MWSGGPSGAVKTWVMPQPPPSVVTCSAVPPTAWGSWRDLGGGHELGRGGGGDVVPRAPARRGRCPASGRLGSCRGERGRRGSGCVEAPVGQQVPGGGRVETGRDGVAGRERVQRLHRRWRGRRRRCGCEGVGLLDAAGNRGTRGRLDPSSRRGRRTWWSGRSGRRGRGSGSGRRRVPGTAAWSPRAARRCGRQRRRRVEVDQVHACDGPAVVVDAGHQVRLDAAGQVEERPPPGGADAAPQQPADPDAVEVGQPYRRRARHLRGAADCDRLGEPVAGLV